MPSTVLILNRNMTIRQVLKENTKWSRLAIKVMMLRSEMTAMFGAVNRDLIIDTRTLPRPERKADIAANYPTLEYVPTATELAGWDRYKDNVVGRRRHPGPLVYFYDVTNDASIQQGNPVVFPDGIMYQTIIDPEGDYQAAADPSLFSHLGIDYYGPTTALDAVSRVIQQPEEP